MIGPPTPVRGGLTVVVPAAAVGPMGAATLDRFGVPVGRVVAAAPVAFERAGTAAWDTVQHAMGVTLAEARQRFAPHAVELVVVPDTPESIADWATQHAPAAIVTTRSAQTPRTLARLIRIAADRRGVSTLVLHPTTLPAAHTTAA